MAFCFAEVLPRHSVTAPLVTRLLISLLAGASLKAAAEALRTPFALETFYRFRRSFRRRLDRIRTCLCREKPAPESHQSDPLLQTAEHFQAVFPAERCPLTAFQLLFQLPVMG